MSPFVIVAVVLFVGALIFVHEMGHFLVAKAFDIKVTKFSLGFGPPLVSFTRGETTYQVAAIPLGGYVKMVGEHPTEPIPDEDRARAFNNAPIHQRALVAIAGPAANLVFPILCFFAYNLLEPQVRPPVVGQVEPGEPADRAGLRPGDRILAVDGHRTWSFDRLVRLISARPEQTVPIRIRRGEEEMELEVTPKSVADQDLFAQPRRKGMISISTAFEGTRVGIDDPARLPRGDAFETGDRVLSIDGRFVHRGEALSAAFAAVAGQEVEVVVARPRPAAAGDVLRADRAEPTTLKVQLPPSVVTLSDIGLALGETFVRAVVAKGAAAEAGVRPGDRIISVDDRPISHFWPLLTALNEAEDEPVKIGLRRAGADRTVTLTPRPVECIHPFTKKPTVVYDAGFGRGALAQTGQDCEALNRSDMSWAFPLPAQLEPAHLSIDEALVESIRLTGEVIGLLVTHLFKMFVTQEVSTDHIAGPLQFFNVAAKAAESGVLTYLQMLALISINLGIFNLLPVPVLDGGHLLFCAVEAVKRKPLSIEARERAALVGLALLAMLLLLALRNDLRTLAVF